MARKEGKNKGQPAEVTTPRPRYTRFRSSYKDWVDAPARSPFPRWDEMTTEEEYGVDDRLN